MGTAVLPHHLLYTVPLLQARWEQGLPRIRRFVRSRLNPRPGGGRGRDSDALARTRNDRPR